MIRPAGADLDGATPETLIVGSGPAGLTLAMELARLGHPSLVLESGGETGRAARDLSDAEIVDPARHDSMRIAVARRFGGTSNLWGGRSIPLDPVDFEPRPFAREARWPVTHAEIAPFYGTACRYATCGDPVFRFPLSGVAAANDDFAFTHIERASNVPRFQTAHRATLAASALVDIRLGATITGLTLDAAGRVVRATVAGAGDARWVLHPRRVVIAAGGLESTRLLLALQLDHAALFGGANGPLGRYYMGHIIGEVADVTFATNTLDAAFDFHRDGHGSYVRRRFTPSAALQAKHDLPNICFWPVVPPIADARHASGPLSAVAMALSTPGLGRLLIPEAIRARHLAGAIDWPAHARNVAADLPSTLGFLQTFVRQRYLSRERVSGYFLRNRARRYGLSYSSEQSPRAESRVILSSETDRLGTPRLRVDLRFHRDDAEAVFRAHEALGVWLADSGFGRIAYRQPVADTVDAIVAKMAHGTHQIGTARMGTDRAAAVVDRDLRCFDVPNLFVASSAVFPTSGQANPTLSIVAFAARLAATLAAESEQAAPSVRDRSIAASPC